MTSQIIIIIFIICKYEVLKKKWTSLSSGYNMFYLFINNKFYENVFKKICLIK